MFKEDHLSFRQRKYMKVKNIIGRALGGIGLVVLSPVYLAIIVAIKKEDGITAPVFFSQKRVGMHKEYFNLYGCAVNVAALWTQEHIWRDIRICRERLAGLYHTLER